MAHKEQFFLCGFLVQNRILTTGLGPLFQNVPPRSGMLLLQVREFGFWNKANMPLTPVNVCFWGQSGH
jgi:hypothetical protein